MDKKYFLNLYREGRVLALLEWAYGAITVAGLLVAGIFALVNQELGHQILVVPGWSFLAMIGNIVLWAVINLVAENAEGAAETARGGRKKSAKK